jgi:hypothetical protein
MYFPFTNKKGVAVINTRIAVEIAKTIFTIVVIIKPKEKYRYLKDLFGNLQMQQNQR